MSIDIEEMQKTLKKECNFVRNLKKLAVKNEAEHDKILHPKTKKDQFGVEVEIKQKKVAARYGSSMGRQELEKQESPPKPASKQKIKDGKLVAAITPRKRNNKNAKSMLSPICSPPSRQSLAAR